MVGGQRHVYLTRQAVPLLRTLHSRPRTRHLKAAPAPETLMSHGMPAPSDCKPQQWAGVVRHL